MIHDHPLLIQIADFGGTTSVIFLIIVVNCLLVDTIMQYPHINKIVFNILLFITILSCVAWYGYYRIHQIDAQQLTGQGTSIQVIAVQTKIHPNESVSSIVRENSTQRFSAFEWSRYAIQQHPDAEFILFPEASVDFTQRNRSSIMQEKASEIAARFGVPILFSYTEIIDDATLVKIYNHAQLIMADGAKGASYQKRILTPFYEYNPFQKWLPLDQQIFIPGEQNVLMNAGKAKIVPAICYELHSMNHIREYINMGGNFIAHLSNFYSFGGGVIAYFDLTMAKLSAVQFRVPIVRASNYGYGAFIDAAGRVIPGSLNQPGNRNALSFSVYIPEHRSFFAHYGNVFLYILTALWLREVLEILVISFQQRYKK